MMVEVIEPNWHEFLQKMDKKDINIDDVLRCHEDFLDQCLKNCFLTSPDLLKTIIQLCNICIDFCNFIEVSIFEGLFEIFYPTDLLTLFCEPTIFVLGLI